MGVTHVAIQWRTEPKRKGKEIKSNKTWCAWMNCRISPRQTEVQEQGKAVYFQIRKNIQDRRPDGLGIKYARKDASEYRAKDAYEGAGVGRQETMVRKLHRQSFRSVINAVDYLKQINDQRLQKHAELEEKVKQLWHGRTQRRRTSQ